MGILLSEHIKNANPFRLSRYGLSSDYKLRDLMLLSCNAGSLHGLDLRPLKEIKHKQRYTDERYKVGELQGKTTTGEPDFKPQLFELQLFLRNELGCAI